MPPRDKGHHNHQKTETSTKTNGNSSVARNQTSFHTASARSRLAAVRKKAPFRGCFNVGIESSGMSGSRPQRKSEIRPIYQMLPLQSYRNPSKLEASFNPTVAAYARWSFPFPPSNRGEISRREPCKCRDSYAPPAHCALRNEAIASSSRGSAASAARKSRSAASAFSKVIHSVSGTLGADHLSRR